MVWKVWKVIQQLTHTRARTHTRIYSNLSKTFHTLHNLPRSHREDALMAGPQGPLSAVFDTNDPAEWELFNRCRDLWGKLYTEITWLGGGRVLLVFAPAPDKRWRPWEERRRQWIERLLLERERKLVALRGGKDGDA